jgi:cell division protein FtsZ
VTKPFHFEGRHRMRLADAGIAELQRYVDTLIVIPNQNLFRVANERTTFAEAFAMADQVLHSGVRSITDLMVLPGLINLDFADVRTVMTEMGKAMMGTGEASGDDRALIASQNAIANPLLDEVSLKGARAVLVNVTGGLDMTLLEVDEAANAISDQVDAEANIIFGAAYDASLEGKIRVSVVATGMDGLSMAAIEPKPMRAAQPAMAPMTMREPEPAREPAPVAAVAPAATVSPGPRTLEPIAEADPLEIPAEIRPAAREEAPLEIAHQGELYEAPPLAAAIRSPEPVAATATIDDEAIEDEAPLLVGQHLGDDKGAKSGWRIPTIFGSRSRGDPPPPLRDYRNDPRPVLEARAAATGGAAAAMQPTPEPQEDAGEDLEIPSFLRRLAN